MHTHILSFRFLAACMAIGVSFATLAQSPSNATMKADLKKAHPMITDATAARALEAKPCTKLKHSVVERGLRTAVGRQPRKTQQVLAYYEQDKLWHPAIYQSASNNYHEITWMIDGKKGMVREVIPLSVEVGDKAIVKSQIGSLVEVVIKKINGNNVTFDYGGQEAQYQLRGLVFNQ